MTARQSQPLSMSTANPFYYHPPHQQHPDHHHTQHPIYLDSPDYAGGGGGLFLPPHVYRSLVHVPLRQFTSPQQQQLGLPSSPHSEPQQQHSHLHHHQHLQHVVSPLADAGFHAAAAQAGPDFALRYHQPAPVPSTLRSSRQQQQQQHQRLQSSERQHQPHQIAPPLRLRSTMADSYPANTVTDDEMAELQKLSNDYEPELSGPLVGPREPSTAITTEYASADPVYQAKTVTLPQKYSHYRKLMGDGLCGWRAIGFGYFESLIRLGDDNKFLEEETRLRSLENVINNSGQDNHMYAEFAEAVYDFMRKLATAMQTGEADETLLKFFNDEYEQSYILTYFKVLTTAWMRTHNTEYAPWLLGQTVEEFCDIQVMPLHSEIESVSLTALKDVLLSPAGIQLEVLYLDRTPGSEANMHRFDPVNPPGGVTIGAIRLLYRPGHYDILYKAEDIPPPAACVQTYMQYATNPHEEPVYNTGVTDFVAMIPGMSFHQGWMSGSSFGGSDAFSSPTSTMPALVSSPELQNRTQSMYAPATTSHMVPPPNEITQEMTIRSAPGVACQSHSGLHSQLDGPFRSSMWELKPDFAHATSQVPFRTSIFRNSHFNTAHFNNPDFQPEEWHPDDEPTFETHTNKSGRHRSFG